MSFTFGTKRVKKGFKGTQGKHQWFWSPRRRNTSRKIVPIVKKFGHKLVDSYLLKKKKMKVYSYMF